MRSRRQVAERKGAEVDMLRLLVHRHFSEGFPKRRGMFEAVARAGRRVQDVFTIGMGIDDEASPGRLGVETDLGSKTLAAKIGKKGRGIDSVHFVDLRLRDVPRDCIGIYR